MRSDRIAKWATLLSCSLSCFVSWLDVSIVYTALPSIQKSLSASWIQLQWMMTGNSLALAVTMVLLGRISDFWGRRLVNIIGVILFGIASLFAGLSISAESLIIFRFLQGIAAAAIIPS